MIGSIKHLNSLSHTELLNYVREFLDSVAGAHPGTAPKLVDIAEKCFSDFQTAVSGCRSLTLWPIIDEFEEKRYTLWERIADRLNDNLNIFIVDEYSVLKKIGMTRETALHEIPSYDASWMLLNEDKAFPTGQCAVGHFWKPELMDKLISRLTDLSNNALCRKAGIVEQTDDLNRVEKLLTKLTESLPDPQLISRLRSSRYFLLVSLKVLHSCSRKECSPEHNRNCTYLNAGLLFEDRFRAQQQIDSFQIFSYDQLSLSSLAGMIGQRAGQFFKDESNDILEMLLGEFYPVFRSTLEAFQAHPLWNQFERKEHEFYKEALVLMDKVYNHLTCSNAEDPQVWERQIRSKEYKAAKNLLGYGRPEGHLLDWQPGDIMTTEVFDAILVKWCESGATHDLEVIDALELHRNCQYLNKTAERYALVIREANENADLGTLRKYRYEVSDIVRFM